MFVQQSGTVKQNISVLSLQLIHHFVVCCTGQNTSGKRSFSARVNFVRRTSGAHSDRQIFLFLKVCSCVSLVWIKYIFDQSNCF